MGRFRLVWGLFAFAATFVAFLVLLIIQNRPQIHEPVPEVAIESTIAAEVALRYAVPQEAPIVTRLNDVTSLVRIHPVFYSDLKDGDWLVRYQKLLIVYRQEEKRIVKVEAIE